MKCIGGTNDGNTCTSDSGCPNTHGGSGASCEYVDGGCPFVVREQATCHAGTDTAAENANVACEDPATNAAWAEQHMCENAGCCWNAGLSNKCFNPTGWGGQLGLDLTKGSSNLNYEALKNISPAFTFLYTITATENKPGGGGKATDSDVTIEVLDVNEEPQLTLHTCDGKNVAQACGGSDGGTPNTCEAAGCCWSTKEQKCYLSSVGGTSAALWIIDEARHDAAEQRTEDYIIYVD